MDSRANYRVAIRGLALGWLALVLSLWASPAGGRYGFRVYEHPDGLEDLVIRDLLQDRAGFLWIATHTGLYRFDGRDFRRYTTSDGLADNWITNLAEDAHGVLWVATVKGLCRRDGSRFETVLQARRWLRFRPNTGTPMAPDEEGNLFFSSNDGLFGAWQAEGGTADTLAPPLRFERMAGTGGEHSSTSGLFVDAKGAIWYTGQGGILYRQSRLTGQREVVDSTLPAETWISLLEDRKGGIWLAGVSGAIYVRKPGSRRFHRVPIEYSGRGRLGQTRAGEILVPSQSGFSVVEDYGRKVEKIDVANGLPGEMVECFLEDREGTLWIGSVGTGLIRWLGGRAWRQWKLADGLPGNFVTQVTQAQDGATWVGTLKGLVRFDPPEETTDPAEGASEGADPSLNPRPVNLPAALGKDPPVYAVGPENGGEIWLSVTPGSAHAFQPATGKLTRFAEDKHAPLGTVCHFLEHGGAIWIAGTEGLGVVRNVAGERKLERVWPLDGNASVYRLDKDSTGVIWAATLRGLLRIGPDGPRLFDRRDGLQQDDVFGLSIAPDDSIWIHYHLSLGVSHLILNGGKLRARHYREEDGLASDKVLSIVADRKHRVWVGTEFGVSALDGNPPWITFNRDHGLVWNDCSFAALAVDPAGALWIGTSRGLSRFYPPGRIERPAPQVALTSLRMGGGSVDLAASGGRIHTPADLRISFAALRFSNQSAIRFRYRLLDGGAGNGSEWIYTRDREVNFARLSPGLHRFEVEASEGDGQWSSPASSVEILVPTPWWRQWWSIGVMFWVVLAALRLAWKWRYHRMLRRQDQLESAVGERTRELEVQRERAEAASKFKDQILANVSHEIRTPLNGIVGFASLMLESKLDDDQRDQLRTVYASGKSLVDIIEDLLDFASIEAGELKLDQRLISMAEVVDQTTRTLRYEADRQGLEFRSRIGGDLPAHLLGDDHRLRQILLNLLGNAIKFTEAGSVELRVRCTHAPLERVSSGCLAETGSEQIWVEFEVRDTGIGISPDGLDRIFDPFRQLDGTSRRVYGGTGLGLATVRRIVDGMGGRIDVESALGRGSTFRVILPMGLPMPGQEEPSPPDEAESGGGAPVFRRVLIAEDNPVNQKLLHRILAKRGLEVVTVADGKAAMETVAQEPFDLILMDIQMPVMDGIQATRLIRERERTAGSRRIPVIAVTANGMFQCREECAAVGMDGYVVKPFGPANLFEAIDNVHRRIASAAGSTEPEPTYPAEL